MVYIGIPGHKLTSGVKLKFVAEDIHWKQFARRYKVYDKLISNNPLIQPEMIICIPSYAEPHLLKTLESLLKCDHPGNIIEVLILFNQDNRMSFRDSEIHARSYEECIAWIENSKPTQLTFRPIWLPELPIPKWGVGWARKMLMDEAARRLGNNGWIVNLDADCLVAKNYLVAIHEHGKSNVSDAISIYVEHDVENERDDRRQAIIDYELHLRYLVHAKRWAGHPFAYQTFGSAMAVSRSAYLSQGGMNTRQAGEDFYFLQKFIETGRISELNTTTIFPSSRTSLRVPFGTGKAMQELENKNEKWRTTPFDTFQLIQPLFTRVKKLYECFHHENENLSYSNLKSYMGLDEKLIQYLTTIEFVDSCKELIRHTSSVENFEKRFFRKFNAFAVIRYMHAVRAYGYEDVEVLTAARQLLAELGMKKAHSANDEECLRFLRKLDKETPRN